MERLVTVAKIIESLGPVKGEKTLQKLIYLIDSNGCRLGYQFDWQQYGPISFQLQDDIHEICALGLISITYDNKIPVYRSPRSLNHLREFWRNKHKNFVPQTGLIHLLRFFQQLGEKRNNPKFLEILASMDYSNQYNQSGYTTTIETDDNLQIMARNSLDILHHE